MAAASITATPSYVAQAAALCNEARVTFQQCFPPDKTISHPGLLLFSAPITRGSTLAVPLDRMSVDAIKQRIVDWAADNNIAYTPLREESDFEAATR